MLRAVCLIALGMGSALCAADGPADARSFVGDYAGWRYMNDGSDAPTRLHIGWEKDALSVTLDAPIQKAFRLPTSDARVEDGRLRYSRRNSAGNLWEFEVRREGDLLIGEAKIDGQAHETFELHRCAKPLVDVHPDKYADCRGVYALGPDRTVVVSSWFWGELQVTDTRTGQHCTLFPLSESEFYAGPGLYVPTSVFATLRFVRDKDQRVEELIWQEGSAPPVTGRRVQFAEENVEFTNGEVRLKGTLIKPDGQAPPYSAIVMLGGSNWQTRQSVRAQADKFAALGLATLIYDQRGYGESTAKTVCAFEDTAADARAAVAMLKGRPDVRSDSVGLWGASRGGWFAPLAASKSKDVAFMVLFVPPAISPARQETTRRLNGLRAEGFSESDVKEAAGYLELLWKSTDSDADWERYVVARDQIAAKGWLDRLGGTESRDSEDFEWDKLNMRYDPIPALEKVTCPVLAIFGGKDSNVVPEENIPPMEAALKRAGNKRATLKVMAGADHGLVLLDPRDSRRFHRSPGYPPELWSSIRRWLREQGGVATPESPNRN